MTRHVTCHVKKHCNKNTRAMDEERLFQCVIIVLMQKSTWKTSSSTSAPDSLRPLQGLLWFISLTHGSIYRPLLVMVWIRALCISCMYYSEQYWYFEYSFSEPHCLNLRISLTRFTEKQMRNFLKASYLRIYYVNHLICKLCNSNYVE